MAWRNFYFVHTRVVRQHNISAWAIAKQTDDGGMRTVQDAKDTTLGALRARDAPAPLNLHQDVVAVHGVLDGVARDVHVAVKLRDGSIGHDEAIAIGVQDQPTLELIAISEPGRG